MNAWGAHPMPLCIPANDFHTGKRKQDFVMIVRGPGATPDGMPLADSSDIK